MLLTICLNILSRWLVRGSVTVKLLPVRLTRVLVLLLNYRIVPLSGLIGLIWFACVRLVAWDLVRLLLSIVRRRMVAGPWLGCAWGRG